jgi:hypothetical protein
MLQKVKIQAPNNGTNNNPQKCNTNNQEVKLEQKDGGSATNSDASVFHEV